MICDDFSFNGKNLSDFYCSTFDSDTEQTFSSRESIHSDLTAARSRPSYYGVKYSGDLELNFLICKNIEKFSELSERHDGSNSKTLSQTEVRSIRAWLESTTLPSPLVIYNNDNDENENIYYFGFFKDVQPWFMCADCIGLKLTFECDSPSGYSDIEAISSDIADTETQGNLVIENSSDEQNTYVYPIINIYIDNSKSEKGTITIKNTSDNNNSLKLSIIDDTVMTIDCEKNIISNSSNEIISISDLGLDLDSSFDYSGVATYICNIYWPRLVYGSNTIEVSMDNAGVVTKVKILARFVRKVDGI